MFEETRPQTKRSRIRVLLLFCIVSWIVRVRVHEVFHFGTEIGGHVLTQNESRPREAACDACQGMSRHPGCTNAMFTHSVLGGLKIFEPCYLNDCF